MIDFSTFNWFFAILGLVGILLHLAVKTWELGGRQITDLSEFVRKNSLSLVISICSYIAIIMLWHTEGLDFLGWRKGDLTGSTIIVAYVATSLFKSLVGSRLKKVPPDEQPADGSLSTALRKDPQEP